MRKSEKLKYEIDPFNRLIAIKSGRDSGVPQFRDVLDGVFRIDDKNRLTYHVKKPKGSLTPQQLKLTGDWSIDKEHNLVLTLNKENHQLAGDKLTLRAELIGAQSDKIEFSVVTKDSNGGMHFYMLQLAGRWQADEYNCLNFQVAKKTLPPNILILSGGWEINKQNQVIYTYTKEILKTKKKITNTLTFKGFWQISGKYRLLYVLNQELNSAFDFKVSLGKPAARGLEYELGIGASPEDKKITLLGSWKIDKKIGLFFEMPSEEGRLQRITFGAICKLNQGSELELKLKSNLNEDLGINLRFTKNILKDQGQAFVEALKDGREISLRAGLGFRW